MTEEPDTHERLSPEDAVQQLLALERAIAALLRDIRRRSTPINTRWASIANTHFQQGGMALRRALEKPWEQEP